MSGGAANIQPQRRRFDAYFVEEETTPAPFWGCGVVSAELGNPPEFADQEVKAKLTLV